jgi:hypothetical protein
MRLASGLNRRGMVASLMFTTFGLSVDIDVSYPVFILLDQLSTRTNRPDSPANAPIKFHKVVDSPTGGTLAMSGPFRATGGICTKELAIYCIDPASA